MNRILTWVTILGIFCGGLLAYGNQAYFERERGVAVEVREGNLYEEMRETHNDLKDFRADFNNYIRSHNR